LLTGFTNRTRLDQPVGTFRDVSGMCQGCVGMSQGCVRDV